MKSFFLGIIVSLVIVAAVAYSYPYLGIASDQHSDLNSVRLNAGPSDKSG